MIQQISNSLMSEEYTNQIVNVTRGEELEILLTNICNLLGDVGSLTEGKADVEMALGVMAAYLLSLRNGKISKDTIPPRTIFDERLFPQIDNYQEIIVEEIPEDDDREQLPIRTTEPEVS